LSLNKFDYGSLTLLFELSSPEQLRDLHMGVQHLVKQNVAAH